MGLIFLFSLPILSAWQGNTEMTITDLLVASVMFCLIIIQTIADEQQHKYQTKKYELIKKNKELLGNYKKGFIDTGLWKYSRHPNYFGEVSFWFGIYIFALASGSTPLWVLACPLVMLALFVFVSCPMMDNRSLKKRPDYKEYMEKTPQLLFWFVKD
mgnify:CR=1 FL=1